MNQSTIPAQFQQLAVIGLGLIGGSFVKAARGVHLARRIVAYDASRERLERALSKGAIDAAADSPRAAVAGADFVLLATPVRVMIPLLQEIAPLLAQGALLLDVGSTKRAVVAAMNQLPVGVEAVGGHPMAGKAGGGWAQADGALFRDAPFALCPTERAPVIEGSRAEAVVRAMGARPIIMDAATHDTAVARISHLPYLLASTLVRVAQPDSNARALIAGGYRDTSRIAAHDPTMYSDILYTNRDHLLALVREARAALGDLESALAGGDEQQIGEWVRQTSAYL